LSNDLKIIKNPQKAHPERRKISLLFPKISKHCPKILKIFKNPQKSKNLKNWNPINVLEPFILNPTNVLKL
jgi:hypothetical protein